MNKTTKPTKSSQIKREWHLINVKDKILGRAAVDIAKLLMGKSKSYFVRNLDCGDNVVVINAKDVKVTGKKETDKKYYRHSGYPGGLKMRTFKDMKDLNPTEIVKHAVKGMLPQNRLRDRMLLRLFIFKDEGHPYTDKIKGVNHAGN